MKDIAIYGAGGFGREVACLIRLINQRKPTWNLIGFFDDGKAKGEGNKYGPYLGGMEDLNNWKTPLNVVFAIGNPKTLAYLVGKVNNANIIFPNIISPDFYIGDKETCVFGKGNIITLDCGVSTNINIGDFNILNGSVSIGHDTKIGNFNVIMPDVRISGEVTIGNQNLLGVKSLVIQGIKIGDNTVIGAGAVLLTKPKSNNTYLGNPAKVFKF